MSDINDHVSKKINRKRKINKHCDELIDNKIVKLDNDSEKLFNDTLENNEEINDTNDNKVALNKLDNEINGKYMRKLLNGDKKDLASDYLDAKGNLLELIRLFDKCDKKNSSNIAVIFSAMQILIMKILSKYPQYLTNAQQECRNFVNFHISSVHSMFSLQSNPNYRKICLRLLTAIVSLGGNLPRELLGHLSINSQTLELLCQHTKPSDTNNVRICFIHFIVSLLVDGSISVIRALLDRSKLITCIFPGLIYDKSTTVHLILNTVKNYILENNNVSKTMKLHLFSTAVVQNLVNLYNWKGPSNWPGFKQKKSKSNIESIDPEEKRITINIVHEFLLVLLTSTRHGIIFNDKTLNTSGGKHNQLINSILQSLDKPWEHEKPRELVIKILSSSPTLIKSQLTYMEPFMSPRLSKKWIELMQFIRSIIGEINCKLILIPNINELTLSQCISSLLTLLMPQIVLKNAIIPAINNNYILRREAIETLTIMMGQIKSIYILMNNCNGLDTNDFTYFKRAISDYIVKNLPCINDILQIWQKTFIECDMELKCDDAMQDTIVTPSKLNHLSGIIKLLEYYRDVCPIYFNEFDENNSENIKPIVLLNGLEAIDDDNCNEKFNEIKIKAIEFILSINSDALITDKKYFHVSLTFLITLLNNNEYKKLNLNAIGAIKMILLSSGVFEGTEDQIEIWINSFNLINNNDKISIIIEWFVKIIQQTIKKTDKYLLNCIEAEEKIIDDETICKTYLDNIINELYERDSTNIENKIITMQPLQSIPLLFCGAIENLKKNPNEYALNYFSFVAILTLHCQINPVTIINLIENIDTISDKYLSSWKTEKGDYIKKPFNNNDLVRKFSKILLTNDIIEWEDIFGTDKKLKINCNNEIIVMNFSLNNYEILTLLRMTLFYMTQSLRHNNMNNDEFEGYKMLIIVLLNISIKCEDNENLIENYIKLIFTNPIILKYFTPLLMDNNNNQLEIVITNEFILEIVKIIIEKIKMTTVLKEIFIPFKRKFLLQIKSLIQKSMNGWRINIINYDKLMEFIELIQLNSYDIIDLLNGIIELPNKIILSIDKNDLSQWGKFIPKLIELHLITDEESDNENNLNTIKKMINHLEKFLIKSKGNFDSWIIALHKYLHKYPNNIAIINVKLFKILIQHELTPSIINIIGLLINKNDKFIPHFIEQVTTSNSSLIKRSDLIFSILSMNLHHKWDIKFMKNIYQQYHNDIENYLTCETIVTNNWINDNLNSILYLINLTFDNEICVNIIEKILLNGDKLNGINGNYLKLLRCLVKKSAEYQEINNSIESIINFIHILIRIGVCELKKNTTNNDELLKLICQYLCGTIDVLKLNNNNFNLDNVNKNHFWPQFSRFALKNGLKLSKNMESESPTILKALASICSIAYKDNSDDEHAKIIFEMAISHSEFINTLLGNNINKKCDLLELILVLVRKNYSLMKQTHIPLYLSAYNATLSRCDQIILMILRHYEVEKIKLNEYKPYFWGESAANYYSIKGNADTALWRQPTTTQILDLFNIETVTYTIEHFPINRNLNGDDSQYIYEDCVYDPAFYLPLLTHLLADNNVVICNRVTQSGALSLALAACGSLCDDTKIAAFTVLSRFYFHLEATSHKEKLLWMRLIDGLRNGLLLPIKDTKISCLVSTFLAKASLVSTQPLNPLYIPIQSFFMAKPALDLNTIPEFLTLFHSSDVNHKIYRHWILQVIRDGIKSDFDVDLALKCVLFRMIFEFYHSILADNLTKNLILQIVNVTVKIPKARLLLIRCYSVISWLNNVVIDIKEHDVVDIKLITNIFDNLLEATLPSNHCETYQCMLLNVIKEFNGKTVKKLLK